MSRSGKGKGPRAPSPAPAWTQHAACLGTDPDLFFGPEVAEALEYCARCLVRQECRQLGVGTEHGVWGGEARPQGKDLEAPYRCANCKREVPAGLLCWCREAGK